MPVRAKFEHACMISDTVENVGVFVEWDICTNTKYVDYVCNCSGDWKRCVPVF